MQSEVLESNFLFFGLGSLTLARHPHTLKNFTLGRNVFIIHKMSYHFSFEEFDFVKHADNIDSPQSR